jgi:peptide/nickel transport system permease protein
LARDTFLRFRRHKLAVVGAIIYLSLIVLTVFGPLIWRTSISDIDFSVSISSRRSTR